MQPLRIAFIGTGWINSVHAKALKKLPGIEIVALHNHHLAKAEKFNTDHAGGGAKCFDNWKAMFDSVKLDAVYVAIPPGAHDGSSEYAASKGLHLMLEKPIALTNERAESIAAAVRKAGVKCQIGHHMRHATPVIKLKQMIDDGSAGRPLFMQGRFFTNGLFPKWWRDPNLGGGQLVEQSIHIYDLARHFFGEADAIAAFADNLNHHRFDDYKVDDVSSSTIRFKNGGIASLCASNCAAPNAGSITFTVQCQNVAVDFRGFDDATFLIHGNKVSDEINRGEGVVKHEEVKSEKNVYDELSANFISAIREGTPLRSGIDDGVNSLRLVLAAATSAKQNGAAQRL